MAVGSAESVKRVLVLRRGALGDTVVALPCFHLLRRRFPHAQIALLTLVPSTPGEAPVMAVLGGSGLVDEVFSYPRGLRNISLLWALLGRLRDWHADLAVYLAEPGSALSVWRDHWFLRLTGVREVIGTPFSADLFQHRQTASGLMESEAHRLARCLAPLGDAQIDTASSWNLNLIEAEIVAARSRLQGWSGARRYVAFAIGAKSPQKDWGDERWMRVLRTVSVQQPELGLLLVGSHHDHSRSSHVMNAWQGPTLNLCGQLNPRGSAVVLAGAGLYFGHDSGPMHLAAIMGTPTVCVFARTAAAGIWFPWGDGHQPLYPQEDEPFIQDIPDERVIHAIQSGLSANMEKHEREMDKAANIE